MPPIYYDFKNGINDVIPYFYPKCSRQHGDLLGFVKMKGMVESSANHKNS